MRYLLQPKNDAFNILICGALAKIFLQIHVTEILDLMEFRFIYLI